MKKSNLKLWSNKKKVVIVIGLLVLLTGFGGGAYAYVDYQNKMQEEQELQAIKVAEQAIASFYVNEEKAELVMDIDQESLDEVSEKISVVSNEKSADILTKDLKDVEVLLNARERVRVLLDDGILVEDADEKQITNISKLIIEINEINNVFAKVLNKDVEEIKSQYESLLIAKEKVYVLFSDETQETMKKEVTRDQYKEAKSSLKEVLNKNEKNKLQALLKSVGKDLTTQEKAEKKRLAAEKKEKEEHEEKERQIAEEKERLTVEKKDEETIKPSNNSNSSESGNTDIAKAPKKEKEKAKPNSPSKPTYIKGVLIASKKYPLPENYAPGESGQARSAFNQLAAAGKKEGFNLTAFSTYRSYVYQIGLFDRYVQRNGEQEANRYSARAGESEHQTGLAFDVGEVGKENEWARQIFGDTKAGKWVAKNAHHSGFIVRYPQGKEGVTGYIYEPWHLRYLGKELATKVYNSGLSLEEYIGA